MRKKSYKKQYFIKPPHVTVLALLPDALPLKYFLFPDQIHNIGKSESFSLQSKKAHWKDFRTRPEISLLLSSLSQNAIFVKRATS